jgi:hypothetical protein
MTLSSANNKSGPYAGNGVTTAFAGTFRISDPAHVQVIETDAAGVETVRVLTADYAVSDMDGTGFSVTMLIPPVAGSRITLIRNVPFTQEVDLQNQGAYFAEVIEQALDAAVSRDQQLQEQVSRSVKIPASADLAGLDTLIGSILVLGENTEELTELAAITEEVETLAAIGPQITTVAGIAGPVTTVSGIAGAVTTVAAANTGLSAISTNLSALLAVPGAAAASASAASSSATAAAGSASAAATSASAAAASASSVTPLPNQVVAVSAITTIADADLVGITETTGPTLKKITWASVKATTWAALGGLIAGGTPKGVGADPDTLPLSDSAASGATKKLSLSNLWVNYLKAKTDALYQPVNTILTTLGNLVNGAGYLSNNGAGVLSWGTPAAGGMTLLGTIATTSGLTKSLTNIPAGYRQLYLEFDEVGLQNNSTINLALSSTNGGAYGTAKAISASLGGTDLMSGFVIIGNVSSVVAAAKSALGVLGTASVTSVIGARVNTNTAADVDAIQISASQNFDTGEIRIFGVK